MIAPPIGRGCCDGIGAGRQRGRIALDSDPDGFNLSERKITVMSERPDLDPKAIRAALEDERAELLAVRESSAEDRRPVELDQQSVGRLSRMDAMQVQAMAQAVEARRKGRLQRIEAALKRLDEGDYGFCVACGEEIPMKRLTVDLTLAHCVDCAE